MIYSVHFRLPALLREFTWFFQQLLQPMREASVIKKKLIKKYLRSMMPQEWLTGLAVWSIKSDAANKTTHHHVIGSFAERPKKLNFNILSGNPSSHCLCQDLFVQREIEFTAENSLLVVCNKGGASREGLYHHHHTKAKCVDLCSIVLPYDIFNMHTVSLTVFLYLSWGGNLPECALFL